MPACRRACCLPACLHLPQWPQASESQVAAAEALVQSLFMPTFESGIVQNPALQRHFEVGGWVGGWAGWVAGWPVDMGVSELTSFLGAQGEAGADPAWLWLSPGRPASYRRCAGAGVPGGG